MRVPVGDRLFVAAIGGLLGLGLLGGLPACGDQTIILPPGDMTGGEPDPGGGDVPIPPDGGAADENAPGDGAGGPDEPNPPDAGTGPTVCRPNNDGTVAASEVVLVLGAVASYLTNAAGTTVAVDPDGTPDPDHAGQYIWDFSEGPRDIVRGVGVEAMPADAWYAEHFPHDVTYVAALGPQTPDLLGVFRSRGDILEMLGLASRSAGAGRTLLVYDEPVVLYRFPLVPPNERGTPQTWSQTATFSNAVLQGASQAGREEYRFTVDRAGTVILPNFTFTSVVRIRLDLTQTLVISRGSNTLHSVQYFYFTECVGELARIVSATTPAGPSLPLREANEFRRLGL